MGWSENPDAAELLEQAWGIIANVSGGDWEKQPEEWRTWAAHWRDRWIAWPGRTAAAQPGERERAPNDWTALQAFGFAVLAAGGEVRVPRSLVLGFEDDGWTLHRWDDPATGDTVFSMRRRGTPDHE